MPTPPLNAAPGRKAPSRLRSFKAVAAVPLFLPLLAASVLVGFRDSMSLPYIPLFAVERAHMGPLAVGIYFTVRAAGAVAFSLLFGAWFDRRPSLRPLLISLVAGCVGYALQTATGDLVPLCLIAAVPLGMGAAAFPLIFAVAKGWAAKAEFLPATRSIALLRASFSLAWGVGPALGAVVVRQDDYNALFWVSALFSGLALGPFALMPAKAPPHAQTAAGGAPIGLAVALAAGGLILFSMAVGMGAVALPIAITVDFAGSKSDVGLAFSVCALLEAPVMMAIVARPVYFLGFRGMAVGFVALAAYFVAAALASSAGSLVWAQAFRAVGIGFVSCVGISYLQDLLPSRIGAASALYGNTGQMGQLLAGLAAGAWAQAFGYHSLFWPCAVVSVAGLALLSAGRLR